MASDSSHNAIGATGPLAYAPSSEPATKRREHRRPQVGGLNARRVRLVSGLIIFVYLLFHLLDLAAGNVSIASMEAVLKVATSIWRSWPGTIALYGALVAHAGLGFWALYERRMFRYRRSELPQLLLGLLIPFLLINHIIVTRGAYWLFGTDKGYVQELYQFWVASWFQGAVQVLVLVVAWVHACIGIHLWLRLKPWYRAVALPLFALAVLIPAIALLGFYQGGRIVVAAAPDQAWRDLNVSPIEVGTDAEKATLATLRNLALTGFALLLLSVFAFRTLRRWREAGGGLVTLTYPDRRSIRVPVGMSILEASTRYEMPHAGVCGGRGRCGTCRVAVLSGAENIPAPTETEEAILKRIGAVPGSRTRIGCQARPTGDVTVVPILPAKADPPYAYGKRRIRAGHPQQVVCMFVEFADIGAPEKAVAGAELLFVVNRFLEAAIEAITRSGGKFNRLSGAGLLALFDGHDPPRAARQALDAAAMVAVNIEHTARLIGQSAADLPFVIGVAAGRATVGDITCLDEVAYTVVGGVVRDAAELCNLGRVRECELVVAADVFRVAGVEAGVAEEVAVPGSDRTIPVFCLKEAIGVFGALDSIADNATKDVNALQASTETGI